MKLTTREIASLFWTSLAALLCIYVLSQKKGILSSLIRAALRWKLLGVLTLGLAYTAGVVFVLDIFNIWSPDLLKETLLWFLASGIALTFSVFRTSDDQAYWRHVFLDQFRSVVLLEFIISTYTFPLIIEFVLFPAASAIAILYAWLQHTKEHPSVTRFLGGVLAVVGFGILVSAVAEAFSSPSLLRVDGILHSVFLPPTLTVLFGPCIYLVSVLVAYDDLWMRLGFGANSKKVACLGMLKILRHTGLRRSAVRQLVRDHALELIQVRSLSDLDRLITPPPDPLGRDAPAPHGSPCFDVEQLRRAASPDFPFLGWKWYSDLTEFMGTELLRLPSTGIIESSLTYTISGRHKNCATEARLSGSILAPGDESAVKARFSGVIVHWLEAMGFDRNPELESAVQALRAYSSVSSLLSIEFTVEERGEIKQLDGRKYSSTFMSLVLRSGPCREG